MGTLAGCQGVVEEITGETTTQQPQIGSQRDPSPTVKWSESLLEGGYKVTADIRLDTLEEIQIRSGVTNTITTIRSNGKHTIFGPDTGRGPAEMGQMLDAVWMEQLFEDSDPIPQTISSHVVGSEEQRSIPLYLAQLHGSTDPDLEQSGLETQTRTYTQDQGLFTTTELTLNIPTVLVDYYEDRTRTREYGAYVSDTYDDTYINTVVGEFERYGQENGLSDIEIINHMMRFVQNLEYSKDSVATGFNEYPKYPVETLVDKGGDCEDTAILLASMLEEFGYGVVLLGLFDANHMALGLAGEEGIPGTYYEHNGRRYYYVETTASGWDIGEVPDEAKNVSAEIIPIDSHAVLVFSFTVNVKTDGPGGVKVETSIRNIGDAPATNAKIRVIFETRDGQQVASQTSSGQFIPPEESVSPTLELVPPDDQPLRARVQVSLDDDQIHDEMVTEVVEPMTPRADEN